LLLNTSKLWKIGQAGEMAFVVETDFEIHKSRISMKNALCSVPLVRSTEPTRIVSCLGTNMKNYTACKH
jgi:hypothetical protein